MRFYLIAASIILGLVSWIPLIGSLAMIVAVLGIAGAIGLTLLTDPTKAEMKKSEDSKMKLTTVIGGIALWFFIGWTLPIMLTVFYFTYTARFNVMIQRMKMSNTMNNDVDVPVENEVN